jgi:hypothetical protein
VPNTGILVEINAEGTVSIIDAPLNLPTSMEIVGNDAYIVSLDVNVYRAAGVSANPFGE